MIEVIFKNMDTSESLRDFIKQEIKEIIFSHPNPALLSTRVTLDVQNSRFQPGKDLYNVKIVSEANRHKAIVVEKGGMTIHAAVRNAINSFSGAVEKFNQKSKKLNRQQLRSFENELHEYPR